MGKWYKVTKKIHGRFYDYWQRTERHGKQVKTFNKYIGPTTGRAPLSGWSTMSGASRHNAQLDRTFNNALQAKKEELARREAEARFPSKDASPIEKQLAYIEWQIYGAVDRREKTVMSHPDHRLLQQQIDDLTVKRAELQKQRAWYSNENQRNLHRASIDKVVKEEFRGPKYEAVDRAFSVKSPLPGHTAAMEKLNPYHGADDDIRKTLLGLDAERRAEDEAVQYGGLSARKKRHAAKLRAAKRKARGNKYLNPFLGQAIRKK